MFFSNSANDNQLDKSSADEEVEIVTNEPQQITAASIFLQNLADSLEKDRLRLAAHQSRD